MMVAWSVLKSFVDSRQLSIQWIDDGNTYFLAAFDNSFSLECNLNKNNRNDELEDFENNYKANGNKKLLQTTILSDGVNYINQTDTDNAQIVRIKAAKRGWSFWAVPIEITTSTISGSLFCQTSGGVDIPWISCKIYDNEGDEITTPGLLNANLASCVKTVIDFEPTFDFEIIGGDLRINSNPTQDVRLWIVGAPDIPENLGGSKEFASGINLKFMAPDSSFTVDGRVTKSLTYNPVTHQGKMRIILKHSPGIQVNMQFVVHLYRL